MILEEQRFLHEDLERLEQGIADRVIEDPRSVSCPLKDQLTGIDNNPDTRATKS